MSAIGLGLGHQIPPVDPRRHLQSSSSPLAKELSFIYLLSQKGLGRVASSRVFGTTSLRGRIHATLPNPFYFLVPGLSVLLISRFSHLIHIVELTEVALSNKTRIVVFVEVISRSRDKVLVLFNSRPGTCLNSL